MWKPTLLILSAALTLSACATGTPPMPATASRYLGNADTDCPPLPSARSGKLADLVKNHKEVTDLYHECKARHREALKRANLSNPASGEKAP